MSAYYSFVINISATSLVKLDALKKPADPQYLYASIQAPSSTVKLIEYSFFSKNSELQNYYRFH